MSFRPMFRIYQRGNNWTDFHEIWYWELVWRSDGKNYKFYSNQTKSQEDLRTFFSCRRNKFAINHFWATINILLLFMVTWLSRVHKENIMKETKSQEYVFLNSLLRCFMIWSLHERQELTSKTKSSPAARRLF